MKCKIEMNGKKGKIIVDDFPLQGCVRSFSVVGIAGGLCDINLQLASLKDISVSAEASVTIDSIALPPSLARPAIDALKKAIADWEHEQMALALE